MAIFLTHTDVASLPVEHYIRCHISKKDVGRFEVHKNVNLASFDLLDIKNTTKDLGNVIICQTPEQVYLICEKEEMMEQLRVYIRPDTPSNRELIVFFQALLKEDASHMDDLEEAINDMEDVLLKDTISDYTTGIITFRKELLRLRRYYEQLTQVFDGFIENENGLIDEDDIRFYKFLDQRSDRLLAHIVNLRDYITQVREAYQAQIDIEQNSIMKIFTVITSIFLPLTLLVGWYGMNLMIPEYHWPFGYAFVIILSILVIVCLIIFFKRKKWF